MMSNSAKDVVFCLPHSNITEYVCAKNIELVLIEILKFILLEENKQVPVLMLSCAAARYD